MKPTPQQLRALRARDPRLAEAMKRTARFPGFPIAKGHYRSHFHALASAIIHQQLAGKAAKTIHDRVAALTPGPAFPNAKAVLKLPDTKLRGAGLSRNKMLALQDLARRSENGELPLARIARMNDEAIVERLVEVFGIGEWSAQMFLMFRLGRLDVMPTGDLGIREGLKRLDGLVERPTPKEVAARAAAWRPLCSVASWVLWRVADE